MGYQVSGRMIAKTENGSKGMSKARKEVNGLSYWVHTRTGIGRVATVLSEGIDELT